MAGVLRGRREISLGVPAASLHTDRLMPERPSRPPPLSAILRQIGERDAETISIGQLMECFGGRAMGGLLLVFGLACLLPLPPGGTTIFGAPLVLLAPQLMVGRATPWVPKRLRARTLAMANVRRGLPRLLQRLEAVEAISRPRLAFLFGALGERLIGLVCTVLALVLILPIPLGNVLPAAAVSVLSLSLVQRDGVIALAGYGLAAASAGVLYFAASMIWRVAGHMIVLLTAS